MCNEVELFHLFACGASFPSTILNGPFPPVIGAFFFNRMIKFLSIYGSVSGLFLLYTVDQNIQVQCPV